MKRVRKRNRTLTERLYRNNVLPDGTLFKVSPGELVIQKLENPPFNDEDDQQKNKSSI